MQDVSRLRLNVARGLHSLFKQNAWTHSKEGVCVLAGGGHSRLQPLNLNHGSVGRLWVVITPEPTEHEGCLANLLIPVGLSAICAQ